MAKSARSSKEKESPLLKTKEEIIPAPKYSEEEIIYLGALRTRLENARDMRDREHEEFDGMSYVTNYELNEQIANTFIAPKRNKEDTTFQSGTVRQKLFAVLSALVNLDLSGDISAYDKEGLQIQALGDAMEDIITKTDELDTDDEKKYLRQYELLKHGTVFVEELWDAKTSKDKKMNGKFTGKIEKQWSEKIGKACAQPTRNIIPGINVYLGDITKYNISDQPFIFTVDMKPYDEAERTFGKWERWENVSKQVKNFSSQRDGGAFSTDWKLLESQEKYVEIIRYQDKWNNEFALLINGTLMTPVGLPLPWGYDDYNLAQQNLEPIHAKFAYGKSLVSRTRNKAALLDEMSRLMVLKTQKSYMPPYVNISGRVLSNRVLMPGKITYGIQPNTLVPINEKEAQGVTQAEMAALQFIQESIDSETTSPTFSGQKERGTPTATEIIELQRQAKLMLGLTVFAMSMLEWKLEWLRLKNLLVNWFEEDDKVVDDAREVLKSKYRQVSVERTLEGGQGRRIVVPVDDLPSSEAIMQAEDGLTAEQGVPVRLIFLTPKQVKKASLIWQIAIKAQEKQTSEVSKLLFRAEMADAQVFGPLLKMDYWTERFSSVWEENPQKAFKKEAELVPQVPPGTPGGQGLPGQGLPGQGTPPSQGAGGTLSPSSNLPSPEKMMRTRVDNQLKAGV